MFFKQFHVTKFITTGVIIENSELTILQLTRNVSIIRV